MRRLDRAASALAGSALFVADDEAASEYRFA
jgi:hypothetical protein